MQAKEINIVNTLHEDIHRQCAFKRVTWLYIALNSVSGEYIIHL